jgi:aryl-phospho-beta-D-glucosidase BglC (GH1 family)
MKRTFLLLPLIFLYLALNAQSFIGVKGRNITDPSGNPLLLRGVNLGFWLEPEGYPLGISDIYGARHYFDLFADLIGPDEARIFWRKYQDNYITKEDIQYIKKLGFNSIRVPFDYRLFANEYYLGSYEPRGFELLDRVISWCREARIYVILDMHCAPGSQAGWNSDDGYTWPWLFEPSGEESRLLTIKIWTDIAKRYSSENIVIGYDLLGEPIHQYCDTARLNKLLEPFYKRLVKEIRKVDSNHIMILAGAFWDRNFDVFGKPFDDKLVYTTHLYSQTDAYCSFDYFLNFSKKYNVPLWLGEFGEKTPDTVNILKSEFEKEGFGWCLWTYKKMNNNRCIVKIQQPEYFDLVQKYANGTYKEWSEKVNARPNNELVKRALDKYLDNCLLKNCQPSYLYKEVLGFKQ